MTNKQFTQQLHRLLRDAERRAKQAAKAGQRQDTAIRTCIVREHVRRLPKPKPKR